VPKLSFQLTVPNQLETKEETFTPTGPQHQLKGVAANNVFINELAFGVTNTLGHHVNSKENLGTVWFPLLNFNQLKLF